MIRSLYPQLRRLRPVLLRVLPGALLAALLAAAPASAHLMNMTKAQGEVAGNGDFSLTLSLDLLRASGSAQAYYAMSRLDDPLKDPSVAARWQQLAASVQLRQGNTQLPLRTVAVIPPKDTSLAEFESPVTWPMTEITLAGHVSPGEPITVSFRSSFAFEEPIALSLRSAADGRKQTRLLVANQTSPPFNFTTIAAPRTADAQAGAGDNGFDFIHNIGVGMEHILPGGLDHLLFLLCLFLLAKGWRWLLLYASVFTLAHSITLILAAYRLVEVPAGIVEALIALSILWLAIAVIAGKHAHASLGLIGGFGLLHGLGFANALRSLPLDDHQFLLTLVSFNIGVEVGQVIFLAALWLCLAWCRPRSWYTVRVQRPLAVAVALVSSFWLVQRLASL